MGDRMVWMRGQSRASEALPEASFENIFEEIENGKSIDDIELRFTGRTGTKSSRSVGDVNAIHNRIRKCLKIAEIVDLFEEVYGETPANAGDIENGIRQSRIFIKHHAETFEVYLKRRRGGN